MSNGLRLRALCEGRKTYLEKAKKVPPPGKCPPCDGRFEDEDDSFGPKSSRRPGPKKTRNSNKTAQRFTVSRHQ